MDKPKTTLKPGAKPRPEQPGQGQAEPKHVTGPGLRTLDYELWCMSMGLPMAHIDNGDLVELQATLDQLRGRGAAASPAAATAESSAQSGAQVDSQSLSRLRPLRPGDDPAQTPEQLWSGWALRILADQESQTQADDPEASSVAEEIEHLGRLWEGDRPAPRAASDSLKDLNGELLPHEHGRRPVDAFGIQKQLDGARTVVRRHQNVCRSRRQSERILEQSDA